jgi:hypothetical protein
MRSPRASAATAGSSWWLPRLAAELRAMAQTGSTADAAKDVTAFTERRAPRFDGR